MKTQDMVMNIKKLEKRILAEIDIDKIISEYVQLEVRGNNYFGLCPFHDEKTPSFSVSPTRQMYKCFGCGHPGNVIDFIQKIERLEFIEAIQHLADRYNLEIDQEEYKGFEVVNLAELEKRYEKNRITWKHDKKYLTAYNYKGHEQYFVERAFCHTKDEQFDWLAQVSEKNWSVPHQFRVAFVKALKDWDLW